MLRGAASLERHRPQAGRTCGLQLPPAVLLPVHGVVQIGSNFGRAVLMRRDIARPLVLPFLLGSIAGVALGAQIVGLLPRSAMLALLGAFILWSVWSPKLKPARLPPGSVGPSCGRS